MSEQEQGQQEPSVDDVLAGAAAATQAAQEVPLKPKKERKAKTTNGAANGEAHEAKPKGERKPKQPKVDADGNPIVTVPKGKAVLLKVNGEDVTLESITNDAVIRILKAPESHEGSKRAARAAVLKDGTVQDYFIAGGLKKDLLRYLTTGVVEITLNGAQVTGERQPKVPRPPKAEAEPKAEETGGDNAQEAKADEAGGGEETQQA